MSSVKTQLTGYAVGISVGLLALWYLKGRAGEVVDAINPASANNIVYKGVNNVVGEKNVTTISDRFFGLIDLLNPFNESDVLAEQTYGIDKVKLAGDGALKTVMNFFTPKKDGTKSSHYVSEDYRNWVNQQRHEGIGE